MTKTKIAWIAVLATLAGCDGGTTEVDAGRDAGDVPMEDAGRDAGMEDAGNDAGPPATFSARLVNNIPGVAAVHICQYLEAGGNIVGEPTWLTGLTTPSTPVPFRGVSPYYPIFSPEIDYVVALYDAATFPPGTAPSGACPADPEAEGALEPLVIGRVLAADTVADGSYSIIASGFATGTLGATEGELPMRCDPAMGFMGACDADANGTRITVLEDDLSAAEAGMVKIRVSNQVPNSPPLEFMVCYDADLVPHTDLPTRAQGGCEEVGISDPELISTGAVAFGEVTDYAAHAPIQPTIPAMGIGGGFYLAGVAPGTTTCPTFDTLPVQRCFPIVADAGRPGTLPDQIQTNLTDGDILTFFMHGTIGITENPDVTMEDYRVKFFPWADNFVPDGT